jgi:hypothetical protein
MKLRLGPLPRTETIKVSIALNFELKERLERYAKAHGEAYGQAVTAAELIPHILEAYLRGDRAFKRMSGVRKEGTA